MRYQDRPREGLRKADAGRLVVFGGTTEGRLLARALEAEGIPALISVATEYGRELLAEDLAGNPVESQAEDPAGNLPGSSGGIQIVWGRLDEDGIRRLLREQETELVVDATHPYAREATAHIEAACRSLGIRLIRCLREPGDAGTGDAGTGDAGTGDAGTGDTAVFFDTMDQAAAWLDGREGNILVTTGAKELSAFSVIREHRRRIYARVLPAEESIARCRSLGYEGRHIIALQGPFSVELNQALLREFDCRYLVTKDGGSAGGFQEKIEAARLTGAAAVVIRRPGEQGLTLESVMEEIKEWKKT